MRFDATSTSAPAHSQAASSVADAASATIPLGRRLDRIRRALGTGLAFIVFYSGCVLIIGPVFVVTLLSTRDPVVRSRRVQRAIHAAMCFFTWLLEAAGLLSTSRAGLGTLDGCRGTLIIANHPTLLDVTFLLSYLHPVDCVVKRDLWRSALTRACVVGANYIPNDEGAALVSECVARLRQGRNVLLFPEGTRSPVGGLRTFQRGVARIALESGCAILPILIRCDPPFLTKGSKWYQSPLVKPHFDFSSAPRIAVQSVEMRSGLHTRPNQVLQSNLAFDFHVDPKAERPAAVRQLTQALQSFYERQLHHDRA